MSKIVHFEIESSNFDASKDFYAACFGWTYELYEQLDYHQIDTGKDASGINGGFMPAKSFDQKIILTINVEDLDEKLVQIANHGGSIVMPPQEIPGVGRLAYFKDPLDTIMGLMQPIVYKEENATEEI
jgi:hypothetical protein